MQPREAATSRASAAILAQLLVGLARAASERELLVLVAAGVGAVLDVEGASLRLRERVHPLVGAPLVDDAAATLASDLRPPYRLEVPLDDGGAALGALTCLRTTRPFDEEERAVLEAVAATAALVVARQEASEHRRRHERLRHIVDEAQVGIAFCAADGSIVDVNASLLAMLGRPRDDRALLGRRWSDLVAPALALEERLASRDVDARGRAGPYESALLRASGSEAPVLASAVRVGGEGDPWDRVYFVVDLTARKRAEQLLGESELRHRFALKSAGLGSWELDVDTMIAESDRRHDEIYGQKRWRGTWGYAELLDHVLFEDRDAVDRKVRRAIRNASDLVYEARIRRLDGEVRWIEVHGIPHAERGGATKRMLGIVADVTERKRAEHALRESEARYRIMGETLPYGVWLADPEGRCEYLSQSFLDLVGRPLDELRGLGWTDTLDPTAVASTVDAWRASVATGRPWEYELRVRAKGGEWRTVLVRGLPVRDERRRITCWVGIHLDITERKKMELDLFESRAELQRHVARLEAEDQRKDEFLAILGHELRNPLAAITNGIRILERDDMKPDAQRWARGMLSEQARRLTSLVDDLLDLTRIRRGKVQLRRDDCDLAPLARAAVASVKPLFDERRQSLVVEARDEPLVIHADRTRLEQIVDNLLSNASKYTPEGGQVRLELGRAGEHARLDVKDTGVGLAPDARERIFEPFMQIKGSSAAGGGLGIGLTLVRQLVELHGGRVVASSDGLGKGSTFTVTLPLARVQRVSNVLVTPARAELPAALRVLVVDDNCDAAVALGLLLRRARCLVETAFTGSSAIERAQRFFPDVVLCDLGLPDISGFEVAERLRHDVNFSRSLLVALTGFGQEEIAGRVKAAGFDLHLLKPVDPEALIDLVARAVARGESARTS